MPSDPEEGRRIALARIAEEKETRSGFLDLGHLGLTELPEELFALEHLSGLNLGRWWTDRQNEYHQAASDLAPNQVSHQLSRLQSLPGLRFLSVSGIDISDLAPLAGFTALQSLDCSWTQVGDLAPLAGLTALQSLNCSWTQVGDLAPLAGLTALQSLNCSVTWVGDLAPLAGLAALQSLHCWGTQVGDLAPLAGLTALQSLHCWGTQVGDLAPLAGLTALQSLNCDHTQVSELPEALVWRDSLQKLYLFNTRITDIPAEVLSLEYHDDCLERLRAHLRDLEFGGVRLPDVKALVLGNGRIGKTQICRRLRGEAFEPNADSTHGILVTSAILPMSTRADDSSSRPDREGEHAATPPSHEARLHLWDFGGQDLYHGTHALFMRTRSIFVLVWTPRSEDAREHEHRGMTFRNSRLPYWLEFVRHFGGAGSPVLIVQNLCERAEDEALRPPVEDEALRAFPFRKVLHYIALNDRGRGALDDALGQAVAWLWERTGQARIGTGRLAVKRKLEALRDADAHWPTEQRTHRTLTQEVFQQLCDEAGGVSRPAMLLDYLHQTGVVFYHKGLFDDRIVLDQAWALEAVYAVFHREKSYRQLRQLRGRFNRSLLEALVWRDHGVEEQKLFLSLMTSCGICFVHREGDREGKLETEYIAPDLLPSRDAVAAEIEAMWPEHAPGGAGELVVVLPFLHPGVMRGIISRIGKEAGISAVYWKYGVSLYEQTTRSHALIEQRPVEGPTTWGGRIAVSARGGQALELLRRLREWIVKEIEGSGCREWTIEETPDSPAHAHPRKADRLRAASDEPRGPVPERALEFAPPPPPADAITYCVSYAWNDASKAVVDRLCDEARRRGKTILRDTTGLGLGESITKFMRRLGSGDRVFVILSGKYLKSPYCMDELLEVYRNCKTDDEEFRKRIRVFRLPDAEMMTPLHRARCAKYWKAEFTELDALIKEEGADLLGVADFKSYRLMQDFAHNVSDMLALIADTLQPTDFEQLADFGFDGKPPVA